MFQVKAMYTLPKGSSYKSVFEFMSQDDAEECFDRWYSDYKKEQNRGTIKEFTIIISEIREICSVISSS